MRYTVSHSREPGDSSGDTISFRDGGFVVPWEQLLSDGLEGRGWGKHPRWER
jgi:hypothetical protein